MNYRPLGQGLAGVILLAHASFLAAAASDAIRVESRSNSAIVLPTVVPASAMRANVGEEPTANAPTTNPLSSEATQASTGMAGANTSIIDVSADSAAGASVELLPFQAPTEDGEMAGIESQYQQQILQQEVQTLRGLVEELQFQLQRMKKTQEDRYLELDGRFQALRGSGQVSNIAVNNMNSGAGQAPAAYNGIVNSDAVNGAANGLAGTEPADLASTGAAVLGAVEAASLLPTGQSEKNLYDTALELIRNRQYDLAITQLQAVIDRYPVGDYAPNAYYWLGEVYAARPQPDLEKAQQALAQVISSYPGHRKVPDAAFKLGKVYHLMGDCDKSRDLLSQVADQHQGKTVGKLAASYLRDSMIDCQS